VKRTDLEKINVSTLVSLIFYGANKVGYELAKTLSDQGSQVIVVDSYTRDSKKRVQEIKKLNNVDFVDFQGVEDLMNTLQRFDYCYYLQSEFLNTGKQYRSKDFLKESNMLNLVLKGASKYNAKVSLITSLSLNRSLVEALSSSSPSQPAPYSAEEIQKYAETVTAEFHDKSGLNARIIRLATILGSGEREFDDTPLNDLLNSAVDKSQIEINGDGLNTHYLIDFEDAIYGILRMTFKKDTDGEVISLANNKDYTTLAIAYKLLELNPTAQTIRFLPLTGNEPMMISQYVPAAFADEYGWSPNKTLEQSITGELDLRFENISRSWDDRPTFDSEEKVETTNTKLQKQPQKKSKKQPNNAKSFLRDGKSLLKRNSEKAKPNRVKTNYQTEKTELGRFIDKLLSPFQKLKTTTKQRRKNAIKATPVDKAKFAIITTSLIILFYFLIGPMIILGIGGTLINKELKLAYDNALSFDLDSADAHFEKLQTYYDRTEGSFKRISWAFSLTNQGDFYQSLSQLYYGAGYGVDGSRDMIKALEPLADYIDKFQPAISIDDTTPVTTEQYRQELLKLRENRALIASGTYKLGLASDVVENLEVNTFPKKLQTTVADMKEFNREAANLLEPFQQTVTFLPELLGVDGRQKYLILLQNPTELRSTGGWLSSYAILGIESGQIMQLDVDDIYNIEGFLSIQGKKYPAPADMKNALDLENWSFSLVNWDPNLSKVTESAEMFMKDSGKALNIDGIITLDTEVVRALLDTWDGIEVPGEAEIITSENLYEKIFTLHSEFTPGSRQKTTFLANLANEVFRKVLSSDASEYSSISTTLYDALQEKHILAYVTNAQANAYLANEGWNGSIESDHLGTPVAVEWNWGANKSNLYLERTTDLDVNIKSTTEIDYTYKLAIKNNSKANVYPQGDYVNYLRLYFPENAEIISTKGFDSNSYDIYIQDGRKVLGGWFNTPIQKTKQLEIQYKVVDEGSIAFPIEVKNGNVTFESRIFKQAGLNADPYSIALTYPDGWDLQEHNDLDKSLGLLSKQFELKTDKDFRVVWKFK
jgi:nucleoside-diphosphate-sugar epimerase